MSLGDPFQTTYEGAYKSASSLGENLLAIAGIVEKRKKMEMQQKLKQTYPTPSDLMTALMIKEWLSGKGEGIQRPAKTRQEVEKRIKERGEDPDDFIIKETKSSFKGVPQTEYIEEPLPKKPLTEEQNKTISSGLAAISNLNLLKDLKNKGVKTGPMTIHDPMNPVGTIWARRFGQQKDIDFAQAMRLLQSNFVTSQTGAQRGFTEIQWLLPAMPGGELPDEKFNSTVESAKETLQRNIYNALNHAKKTRKDIGEYKNILPQLEEKYGKSESTNIDENLISQYMKKYPNRSKEQIIKAIKRLK